jgi:hypothetical protein
MPKSGWRVRLENGLKLDLNELARRGFVTPGAATGPIGICWTSDYCGDLASGLIWADMRESPGFFRIKIGDFDQQIRLKTNPRHLDGRQWYFICPTTGRAVSVLWKPPGANMFRGRRAWGRQVAYVSQFSSPYHRWRRAQSKIKARLIGDLDPGEWDLPPKPKWMRWRTYERLKDRFDWLEERMESELDIATMRRLRTLKNLV